MPKTNKTQQIQQGKLTALALALSGMLAAMVTTPVQAQTQTLATGSYAMQSWSSGDLIIDNGAVISTTDTIAVSASGLLGTFSNNGTLTAFNTSNANHGIRNSGTIIVLSNTGLIEGYSYIIENLGTIVSLSNTGTISNNGYGILNNGSIGTLTNTGIFSDNAYNIVNNGSIGTLTNSGIISGYSIYSDAIYNSGAISTLINSGTISASHYAIYNSSAGSIGTLINTGIIAGSISNDSTTALTITGGSGTIYGTLTGYDGSIGSLTSASGLTLSGNQLLNDHVDVGSGTLTNTGALQINNPLTITGNYAQGSGATLVIGVVSPIFNGDLTDSGYGRLYVTGNATLDNSTITVKSAGYALAQGQRYVVVTVGNSSTISTTGITYTASGYTVTGTTQSDSNNASYTDLVLTLSGASTVSDSSGSSDTSSSRPINRATTGNATAALGGLFKYGGTDASLLSLYNPATSLDSATAANQAGAQLSPTALNSGALHAVEATTQAISNVTTSHLDGLRLAQAGGSGVATGESPRDIALWGQVFGGRATQGLRDTVSGYHANYHGLLIGADSLVTDALRTGALISAARTILASDGDNTGSSATINNYGVTAYATYTGEPWYFHALASIAHQQYSTVRSISYTGFSGVANGSFNGRQYSSVVQAGYPLNLERWLPDATLTPLAGLSYNNLRQNGYTETGGSGADLQVNASSSSSLKSELAARLEQRIETAYGQLLPSMQLGWRHEYRDGRVQTGASFVADSTGSTAFVTQAASPVANVGVLNLGVTLLQGKHLSLSARYTLESGGGYTAQTGSMLARWQY